MCTNISNCGHIYVCATVWSYERGLISSLDPYTGEIVG